MFTHPNKIIKKVSERFPKFHSEFQNLQKDASEIIFFGSFACGCENNQSDIDIIFIGEGTRKASKDLDFIWITPQKLTSKSWLCTELAIHIAEYGVWYKGVGEWKKNVFFNKSAETRKKQLIFERLIHLYLNKDTLDIKRKIKLLQKILLNSYRLTLLQSKIPTPPTHLLIQQISSNFHSFTNNIFTENMLGNVGKILFEEIFQNENINKILNSTLTELTNKYKCMK